MGLPVTVVTAGGIAVTEALNGLGLPVSPIVAGGLAVTQVTSGGLAVVGLDAGSDVPPNYRTRAMAGSFVFSFESMDVLAGYSMQAQAGAFAFADPGNTNLVPPTAAYTGPGEVTGWGTAYGYWGLRAYNVSKIGQPCIDVCANLTGVAVSLTTVVIGADGYADLTPIGFSPIYVNKIYDQSAGSGTAQHLFLDAGERPSLTANMVGGKPSMFFPESFPMRSVANAVAMAQPFTTGIICRSSTWTNSGMIICDGSYLCAPMYHGTANAISQTFDGSNVNQYTGVADNTTYSLIAVAAGNSSSLSINGATPVVGSSTPGTNGMGAGGTQLSVGGTAGGGNPFKGYIFEIIIKGGAVSAANQTALSTNQHLIGTGW
jgi:hypothetical protein